MAMGFMHSQVLDPLGWSTVQPYCVQVSVAVSVVECIVIRSYLQKHWFRDFMNRVNKNTCKYIAYGSRHAGFSQIQSHILSFNHTLTTSLLSHTTPKGIPMAWNYQRLSSFTTSLGNKLILSTFQLDALVFIRAPQGGPEHLVKTLARYISYWV